MRNIALVAFAVLVPASALAVDPWPQFRGPGGQGHSDAVGMPLVWSETQNIAWKTPIPGRGHSSPVVGRGLAWITTAEEEGASLWVVAVDVATGNIVHRREVLHVADPPHVNAKNNHASPTAVVDGDRVFVHFGASGTAALSTQDAHTLWINQDLKIDHQEGPGSSPMLWKNTLIVHCDGRDAQYIVALDKDTGKIVWKTERTGEMAAKSDMRKAFCTPLVIEVEGKPLLISPAAFRVFAYDPDTGREQWSVQYAPGFSNVPRPVYGHGLLFISTGYMKPQLWAIRPEGAGDLTATNVAWKMLKGAPANPSPVLVGDLLYVVSDAGILTCLDARTGEQRWQKRIGGAYWASPLAVDGRIYFWSEEGESVVIAPGDAYQELARNRLDEGFWGSPAVVDAAFIARTSDHLYRIENRPSPATAQAN